MYWQHQDDSIWACSFDDFLDEHWAANNKFYVRKASYYVMTIWINSSYCCVECLAAVDQLVQRRSPFHRQLIQREVTHAQLPDKAVQLLQPGGNLLPRPPKDHIHREAVAVHSAALRHGRQGLGGPVVPIKEDQVGVVEGLDAKREAVDARQLEGCDAAQDVARVRFQWNFCWWVAIENPVRLKF